jgi:hypothetical protein
VLSHEGLGGVGLFDPRDELPRLASEIDDEPEEAVGSLDGSGLDNSSNPEVDSSEVFDSDFFHHLSSCMAAL